MKMKVGDYVGMYSHQDVELYALGVVVGFNEKGEGGKHFVHVLTPAGVEVYPIWNLHVIDPEKDEE